MRTPTAALLVLVLACPMDLASADVSNMGGTRDPNTGQWTALASLETVPVGDAGNVGQLSGSGAGGAGIDRVCGSVGYTYNIGKYEVTAGQYTEFLNKVAGVDTYGLYNPGMWSQEVGCKIERCAGVGTTGDPYQYRVAADYANRPVNYVSFGDACRFANWLQNGQPSGAQTAATTEDGAYALNGATSYAALLAVTRKASWQWAVTSEDEWYKAAYYDPNKAGGAGYWLLPTRRNTEPGQDMADPSGNNANYYTAPFVNPIDNGHCTTVVGEFQNSASGYGTFDQGGNVWEWNEAVIDDSGRGVRGGSFYDGYGYGAGFLQSSDRNYNYPSGESGLVGFRVSQVAEPATLSLLALGGLLVARRRRVVRSRAILLVCLLLVGLGASRPAMADVFNMPVGQTSCQFVTVGDPGHAADVAYMEGPRGAVSYIYQMGEYDVTAGQYCQFLNAVARVSDSYGLYNPNMATAFGCCGITQNGNLGGYTYRVTKNPDFPVNWVSWGDAARFCNWLSNGQDVAGTTETGSYTLNGAMTDAALMGVTRNPGATYVIPSEDEWYKAAYYKGGGANAGYWLYPTQNDNTPSNAMSSTGTNNVNYEGSTYPYYTDPTNHLTPVGYFAGSPGPYGTFDQGGDVWQWTEASFYDGWRGMRGGSFFQGCMVAGDGFNYSSPTNDTYGGIRVALVPEPASMTLLALGGLLLARRRRA